MCRLLALVAAALAFVTPSVGNPPQDDVRGGRPDLSQIESSEHVAPLSGQVLGPDDKPAAGATVYVCTNPTEMRFEDGKPDENWISRTCHVDTAMTDTSCHFKVARPDDDPRVFAVQNPNR